MKKRSTNANQRLDAELHLIRMGLTRVACESAEALYEMSENLRGNGEDLNFDTARVLADEIVMCADAAKRCTEMYTALARGASKGNSTKTNQKGKKSK